MFFFKQNYQVFYVGRCLGVKDFCEFCSWGMEVMFFGFLGVLYYVQKYEDIFVVVFFVVFFDFFRRVEECLFCLYKFIFLKFYNVIGFSDFFLLVMKFMG